MKVLVCGSRHFRDYELLEKTLDAIQPINQIISGGAAGADTLAEHYAALHWTDMKVFPALWDQHGKSAGPIRNIQMLEEGKPDKVVAFLAPDSIGTKHMIKIAQEAGLQVEVINIG